MIIQIEQQSINIFVSVAMVIINNLVIEELCRRLVNFQVRGTNTQYNISLAQKLSVSIFINTSIIPCLLSFFVTRIIILNFLIFYLNKYLFRKFIWTWWTGLYHVLFFFGECSITPAIQFYRCFTIYEKIFDLAQLKKRRTMHLNSIRDK